MQNIWVIFTCFTDINVLSLETQHRKGPQTDSTLSPAESTGLRSVLKMVRLLKNTSTWLIFLCIEHLFTPHHHHPPYEKNSHTMPHSFMCTLFHSCRSAVSLKRSIFLLWSNLVMTGAAEEMFQNDSGWRTAPLWTYTNFYSIWNVPFPLPVSAKQQVITQVFDYVIDD